MNVVLFEDAHYRDLLPLTWLRPAFELRCGRDRLIDKIRDHLGQRIVSVFSRPELRDVLADRFDLCEPVEGENWCFVNARLFVPGNVLAPPAGVAWRAQGTVLAATVAADQRDSASAETFLDQESHEKWASELHVEPAPSNLRLIDRPWDLIVENEPELRRQCSAGGEHAGDIHESAHLMNAGEITVAHGARVMPGCVLNAEDGPIHIDRDVLIKPNAVIEGPCYIGAGSVVSAGSVIHEATSIGPVCKVGGEIAASIFQGFANKRHDGFLGHSFIAEWVNIGADSVTSDLKNTYGAIRVKINGVNVETGQHFVGSFIGDHAKTGIGTILPTGCVIGVAANVFTQTGVPGFVPSFAWLTIDGMTEYQVDKAVRIARTVMSRRETYLSDAEARLLEYVAEAAREVESAGWASV